MVVMMTMTMTMIMTSLLLLLLLPLLPHMLPSMTAMIPPLHLHTAAEIGPAKRKNPWLNDLLPSG